MKKLLLFGGTTEGRELAHAAATLGWDVTLCVATAYGSQLAPAGVTVRAGRLDTDAMAALMGQAFSCCVDATHPYAVAASENIRAAATAAQLPLLRLLRPESTAENCRFAGSVAQACALVPPGNVLAATGSKEIAAYRTIADFESRVYARVLPLEDSLRLCRQAGLPDSHVLAAKGPFSQAENERVLREYDICSMITKDGGQAGGFQEKLAAAKACGVAVIVVRRPEETGLTYEEILERLQK